MAYLLHARNLDTEVIVNLAKFYWEVGLGLEQFLSGRLSASIGPNLHAIGFKQKDIVQSSISVTPPWLLDHPRVNLDLPCFHKQDTPPEIYRSRFHEICSQYDGFHRLYTDGSKVGDQIASAVVTRNSTKAVRLANKAGIFRVELYAVTLANDFIRRGKDTKFIVFSHSMSSLEALNGLKIELDLKFSALARRLPTFPSPCVLSFLPHVRHLKDKCTEALNLCSHTSIASFSFASFFARARDRRTPKFGVCI